MRHCLPCLILVLFGLFISPVSHSQIQKIFLHPKANGSEKQSNYIDSIRFLPLEHKEGIELPQYPYAEVIEKYFVIRDYMHQAILLYARNGKFIKRISYKKLGQEFHPSVDERNNQIVFFGNNKNYTLTPNDLIKIKLDLTNPRNIKYYSKYTIDLNDTTFIIKKSTPQLNDVLRAYPFYDDLYAMGQINTSELYKDSLDYEFKLYKNNKLVKGYFPYNHINETKYLYTEESVSFFKTDTPYVFYLSRPFCDTIYKIVKDSMTPAYQLVMPLENSLPPYFFTKAFKNKTERENFSRNNGWMFRQLLSFYDTPRFIHFWARFHSNTESYIYNKKTNTTYKTKNIKSDSSQYNLQLLADYGASRNKDVFYKAVKAGDILPFFEKHKTVPVPRELESFIKSNPPATAPVIIEFKLKN